MTLVALGLRWAAATVSGFWTDEAEFLFIARSPSIAALLEFLKLHEAHPPLFYLGVRTWMGFWGQSDASAVALPVISGVALVPLVYLMGARMFSPWVGAGSAILIGANPFLTYYSGYVRPYSTLSLLAAASVGLLWSALLASTALRWSSYATVTAAMLLIHNWGWLVLGAEAVVTSGWLVTGGRRREVKRIVQWLGACLGIAILYSWWLPALLMQLGQAGHAARKAWSLSAPLYPFTEFARVAIGLPAAGSLALLVWLLAVAAWRRRGESSRPDRDLALLLCIGVPFVAVIAAGLLSWRTWLTQEYCLLVVAPPSLMAVTHGLERLARRGAALAFLGGTGALAAIYLLTSAVLAPVGKSNAREFATALSRILEPSDFLVVHPAFVAPSLNYYLTSANSQIDFPFQQRQGAIFYDRLEERSADSVALRMTLDTLRRLRNENRRIWLVTRCDWFSIPRHVPSAWVRQGLLTADVPVLAERFHRLRDELHVLYGVPAANGPPLETLPKREVLCAELYARDTLPGER